MLEEGRDPSVERLYVFDMDDTLIVPPTKSEWERRTGKSWPFIRWWTVPESMVGPIKVKPKQRAEFLKAKQDPQGKVVIMTGRVNSKAMREVVQKTLTRLGFGPLKVGENLFLKKVNQLDTGKWKASMLKGFPKRFPNLKQVFMWDDRKAHVPIFRRTLKKLGLLGKVTQVPGSGFDEDEYVNPSVIALEDRLYEVVGSSWTRRGPDGNVIPSEDEIKTLGKVCKDKSRGNTKVLPCTESIMVPASTISCSSSAGGYMTGKLGKDKPKFRRRKQENVAMAMSGWTSPGGPSGPVGTVKDVGETQARDVHSMLVRPSTGVSGPETTPKKGDDEGKKGKPRFKRNPSMGAAIPVRGFAGKAQAQFVGEGKLWDITHEDLPDGSMKLTNHKTGESLTVGPEDAQKLRDGIEEIDKAWNDGKGNKEVFPNVHKQIDALLEPFFESRECADRKPNKPWRTPGERKKFAVCGKNAGQEPKLVRFGDPDMEIKRDDPERRKNFRARHNCDTAKDKTTPRYWSCQGTWHPTKKVSDVVEDGIQLADEALAYLDAVTVREGTAQTTHEGACCSSCAKGSSCEGSNKLPGGEGHKLKPGDYDPEELKKGIKVELEHTNDPKIAREIALDHLAEDPKYYTKLAKIHHEATTGGMVASYPGGPINSPATTTRNVGAITKQGNPNYGSTFFKRHAKDIDDRAKCRAKCDLGDHDCLFKCDEQQGRTEMNDQTFHVEALCAGLMEARKLRTPEQREAKNAYKADQDYIKWYNGYSDPRTEKVLPEDNLAEGWGGKGNYQPKPKVNANPGGADDMALYDQFKGSLNSWEASFFPDVFKKTKKISKLMTVAQAKHYKRIYEKLVKLSGGASKKPKKKFKPSDYQQAIFDWITAAAKKPEGALVVDAKAGAGKTATIEEALNFIPKNQKVAFLAFNRHIAEELTSRIPDKPNVEAATISAFGRASVMNALKVGSKQPEFNQFKVRDILDNLMKGMSSDEKAVKAYQKTYSYDVADLVNKRKMLAEKGADGSFVFPSWKDTIKKFGKEFDTGKKQTKTKLTEDQLIDLMQKAWDANMADTTTVDYGDFVLFPVTMDLPVMSRASGKLANLDWVMVDEVQDLAPTDRLFIERLAPRTVMVGDPNQSIYAFKGSDPDSMEKMQKGFGADELPLSICYRCPKAVIAEAQRIVPGIEAAPTAKDGAVNHIEHEDFSSTVKDGDYVLARINAVLVAEAMKMLAQGRKAIVKGRDVGASLTSLVKKIGGAKKFQNMSKPDLRDKLDQWYMKEKKRLEDQKKENLIPGLEDKRDCLLAVMDDSSVQTGGDVVAKLTALFSDDSTPGVTFSSIHKSKGLEADNIFIIHPNLLPLPKAVKSGDPVQMKQESNLEYVAITRAKDTLTWVAPPPKGKGFGESLMAAYFRDRLVENAMVGDGRDIGPDVPPGFRRTMTTPTTRDVGSPVRLTQCAGCGRRHYKKHCQEKCLGVTESKQAAREYLDRVKNKYPNCTPLNPPDPDCRKAGALRHTTYNRVSGGK